MTFKRNETFAADAGSRYGEYIETFTSETGQVSAEIFRSKGKLIAYVSFAVGINGQTVTDSYLGFLRNRAREISGQDSLRIIYTES